MAHYWVKSGSSDLAVSAYLVDDIGAEVPWDILHGHLVLNVLHTDVGATELCVLDPDDLIDGETYYCNSCGAKHEPAGDPPRWDLVP